MSDEVNKEILEELKRINEKLDHLNSRKGLSTPLAIMAIVFGFSFVGPLILMLIGVIF
ncbi:hypothetical protein J45TS6_19880 [Paenibacillus sp. J45TS6]|uniref:hypothetical protein n=1 Tax=Paenibacillus sp. J45TS6 TaxID=2807196 RepID=UPI001B12B610|nr:hypothetical protein [Paenibacillus sp. J45TS6]GIP43529.1 hypothetical protein J45TS6_19880 [Paenibacillus sp. J45TS6]